MTFNHLDYRKILLSWAPWAFVGIITCGLIYTTVQQDYRQTANDPQVQLAEDGANRLRVDAAGTPVVPAGDIDIATSLSPYIVYFDESGKPVAGNGVLDGRLPTLPSGAFAFTQNAGEDRFTWQPRAGVRQAVVLVRIQGTHPGFVMSGRSLREVEAREDALSLQIGLGLVFFLVGAFIVQMFLATL